MRRAMFGIFAIVLAGCSGETVGPLGGNGSASILIGRAPAAATSIALSVANGSSVDPADLASLELVIDRVEAHRTGGGAWTSVDVEPVTIDLAAIAPGTAVEVAAGALAEGNYNAIRLFLQSATVTFLSDVTVGGETFLAGQPYPLEIPSVENNGLRVPTAHFTVGAGEESVVVLFDPAATTASVTATGSGVVRMSPVLHEADEATEADVEDEEEEEESSEEGTGSASVLIGSSSSVSASLIASSTVPGGKVDPADVVSLRLVLCEIRAIRTGPKGDDDEGAGEDGGSEGEAAGEEGESEGDAEADEAPACQGNAGGAAWTRIPLEQTEIDLFALGDGEVAQIALGELPAGRYRNVRLYLSEAWITFASDMTFGSTTVPAGEEVPLSIPSAANSGLKIPASHFDVTADGEEALVLLFDRGSVSSIKATGNGIRISPILREADPVTEEALGEDAADEASDEGSSGD